MFYVCFRDHDQNVLRGAHVHIEEGSRREQEPCMVHHLHLPPRVRVLLCAVPSQAANPMRRCDANMQPLRAIGAFLTLRRKALSNPRASSYICLATMHDSTQPSRSTLSQQEHQKVRQLVQWQDYEVYCYPKLQFYLVPLPCGHTPRTSSP